MKPFFDDKKHIVPQETCVFTDAHPAGLLFPAKKILRAANAVTGELYLEGRDFSLAEDGETLLRGENSRIPFLSDALLHPREEDPQFSRKEAISVYPGEKKFLLFDAKVRFQSMQFDVDYLPVSRIDPFDSIREAALLPKFREGLRLKRTLSLTLIGDSISEGFNATGFLSSPPFQKPYIHLFAETLSRRTGAEITVKNRAVNGSTTRCALERDTLWKGDCPDLFLIAYGMNDYYPHTAKEFIGNIAKIVAQMRAHSPASEILLITPMKGNLEFLAYTEEKNRAFRHEIISFGQQEAVEVCDLQTVWARILERKGFFSLTGNGINHPNDYGHRIYANALLRLFSSEK